MSHAANLPFGDNILSRSFIDMAALENARVERGLFPFFIVPRFIKSDALGAISADFPIIETPGSFPLAALKYGSAFRGLIADLQSAAMAVAVGAKLGMDLSAKPTMVTVRGQCSAALDGKIHTDSRTKLVTVLIYMNESWESPKGRLRLLRTPTNLNDVIAEVPPEEGALLVFRNDPNAWHGFEPFTGPRRVIQLNWVKDTFVVRREQTRHRVSAFFKRIGTRRG